MGRIKSFFSQLWPTIKVSYGNTPGYVLHTRERFDPGPFHDQASQLPLEQADDIDTLMSVYSAHVWVYACVYAIATSAATVKWKIYKKVDGKWQEYKELDDPIYRRLSRPNHYMGWYDLVESTFISLELTGNSYWELVSAGRQRLPAAIFPLRSDKIKIVPHEKLRVAHYKYYVQPGKNPQIIQPENVLEMFWINPQDEYYGLPPTVPATSSIITDLHSQSYCKNFFKNSAMPGVVVKVPETLSNQAWRRFRAVWKKLHQGVDRAHNMAILENGAELQELGRSQKDMQFIELRKLMREDILAAYGVPPILVGVLESASRENATTQRLDFWQGTMIPKLQKFQDTINRKIIPRGYEFRWQYNEIPALLEDKLTQAKVTTQLVQSGIWTINEAREFFGMKPVDWGDIWWAPVGFAPVGSVDITRPGTPTAPAQHYTEDIDSLPPGVPAMALPSPAQSDGENTTISEEEKTGKRALAKAIKAVLKAKTPEEAANKIYEHAYSKNGGGS